MSVPIFSPDGHVTYNLQVLSKIKKGTNLPYGFTNIDYHLLNLIASLISIKF